MKLAKSVTKTAAQKSANVVSNKLALLPLVPESKIVLNKDNSVQLEIATNPADIANSPKYKMNVLILQGHEDIRSILQWKSDVNKVLHGMNITQGHQQSRMIESLLKGTPLMLFQSHIITTTTRARLQAAEADHANRLNILGQTLDEHTTVEHIQEAIRHVLDNTLPRRALARIKRFLRRECRKPVDMKVRTYAQHILRINLSELPELPPFQDNNALSNDEVMDILLYGTPKSWQREMERQGYDPLEHTLNDVITFMERVESSETYEPKTPNKVNNGESKKHAAAPVKMGGAKRCMLHGVGNHTTDECKVLQSMTKKHKTEHHSGGKKATFKNQTWSRKAADAAAKSRKDLAAYISKKIKNGVQKELAAFEGKDKRKKDEEEVEEDLSNFDFEGFNLKDLDPSDEEGEVAEDDSDDDEST